MDFIATLIGGTLTDETGQRAAKLIESAGGRLLSTAWLTEGEALDLRLAADGRDAARDALEREFNAADIDVAVIPAENRRRRLFIADMDSTIITVECIDELADFVGVKDEVAKVTAAAMRGELDFQAALAERVALLEGLSEEKLAQCFSERVRVTAGADVLLATLREDRVVTALVSGGFSYFTSRIAEALGFRHHHANRLEIEGGALTGRVIPPIADAATKQATLEELSAENDLTLEDTVAIGDGANDAAMMRRAGLAISYHGKPIAEAAADVRIRHGDLSAVLYVLGYPKADWVR